MIFSLLRFESRSAWSGLMDFYKSGGREGESAEVLLNPDFKEDFLRKNVKLCFVGAGDDSSQGDQSWSRSLMTKLGPHMLGVNEGDVGASEWCWTIDVTSSGYQLCGPGGLATSGADFAKLRSYLELDKSVDGHVHYLGSDWDWDKMSLPLVPRELNVVIWDSYLLRENLVKKNLIVFLHRLHWLHQVERVRCFICIEGKSSREGVNLNDVGNLWAEINNIERATDSLKVDCVVVQLSSDAGFDVGGHGRFLISDTFCVKSGKGFNLDEAGLDEDKKRPNAEGVDTFLNITRLKEHLRDFEKILGRVKGVMQDAEKGDCQRYLNSAPETNGDCGAEFYSNLDGLFKMWRVRVPR